MNNSNPEIEIIAKELGRLYADLYIDLASAVRRVVAKHSQLARRGLAQYLARPPEKRYALIRDNAGLVERGFRDALTTELREKAMQTLHYSEETLAHIAKATSGNPDIDFGAGGIITNGTALGGPTISVTEGTSSITIGAGPEVDYSGAASGFLAGDDFADIADNNVEGGGVWVSIEVKC